MSIDGILGFLILGCGLYCLYAFFMLRFKKEINRTILLPKDTDIKKCKDLEGYCKEAQAPVLLLGVVTTLYGCVDVYNTIVGKIGTLFMIMFAAVIPVLLIYAVMIKKINRKYFGL